MSVDVTSNETAVNMVDGGTSTFTFNIPAGAASWYGGIVIVNLTLNDSAGTLANVSCLTVNHTYGQSYPKPDDYVLGAKAPQNCIDVDLFEKIRSHAGAVLSTTLKVALRPAPSSIRIDSVVLRLENTIGTHVTGSGGVDLGGGTPDASGGCGSCTSSSVTGSPALFSLVPAVSSSDSVGQYVDFTIPAADFYYEDAYLEFTGSYNPLYLHGNLSLCDFDPIVSISARVDILKYPYGYVYQNSDLYTGQEPFIFDGGGGHNQKIRVYMKSGGVYQSPTGSTTMRVYVECYGVGVSPDSVYHSTVKNNGTLDITDVKLVLSRCRPKSAVVTLASGASFPDKDTFPLSNQYYSGSITPPAEGGIAYYFQFTGTPFDSQSYDRHFNCVVFLDPGLGLIAADGVIPAGSTTPVSTTFVGLGTFYPGQEVGFKVITAGTSGGVGTGGFINCSLTLQFCGHSGITGRVKNPYLLRDYTQRLFVFGVDDSGKLISFAFDDPESDVEPVTIDGSGQCSYPSFHLVTDRVDGVYLNGKDLYLATSQNHGKDWNTLRIDNAYKSTFITSADYIDRYVVLAYHENDPMTMGDPASGWYVQVGEQLEDETYKWSDPLVVSSIESSAKTGHLRTREDAVLEFVSDSASSTPRIYRCYSLDLDGKGDWV